MGRHQAYCDKIIINVKYSMLESDPWSVCVLSKLVIQSLHCADVPSVCVCERERENHSKQKHAKQRMYKNPTCPLLSSFVYHIHKQYGLCINSRWHQVIVM